MTNIKTLLKNIVFSFLMTTGRTEHYPPTDEVTYCCGLLNPGFTCGCPKANCAGLH